MKCPLILINKCGKKGFLEVSRRSGGSIAVGPQVVVEPEATVWAGSGISSSDFRFLMVIRLQAC